MVKCVGTHCVEPQGQRTDCNCWRGQGPPRQTRLGGTPVTPSVLAPLGKCGGVLQVEDESMDHVMLLTTWPKKGRTLWVREEPWLWETINPEEHPCKEGGVTKTLWVHVLVAHTGIVGAGSLIVHVFVTEKTHELK